MEVGAGDILAILICGVLGLTLLAGAVLLAAGIIRFLASPFVQIARARQDLVAAIDEGDTARIRLLIEVGAGIHTRGATGRTVLMAAARAGDLSLAKEALWRGADPRARDMEGNTALSLAEGGGHETVVCALRGVPLPEKQLGDVEMLPIPGGAPPLHKDLPVPAAHGE